MAKLLESINLESTYELEYGTVGGGKANAEIAQGIVTIEKNNENPLGGVP